MGSLRLASHNQTIICNHRHNKIKSSSSHCHNREFNSNSRSSQMVNQCQVALVKWYNLRQRLSQYPALYLSSHSCPWHLERLASGNAALIRRISSRQWQTWNKASPICCNNRLQLQHCSKSPLLNIQRQRVNGPADHLPSRNNNQSKRLISHISTTWELVGVNR